MPRELAHRLSVVAPSITLAMNAKAADLRGKGVDVFAFGVGEPDFEPPQHVLDAAKRAIDAGASKYTPVTGILPLREAICAAAKRQRNVDVTPDRVCVTTGAKQALYNIALALYDPGDEVIVVAPYWMTYAEQAKLVGAEPVVVGTREEDGWRVSPEALAAALTKKTKAVILCTPSNPTGMAYAKEHLLPLLEVLRGHDCWLVVDEIYAELVYDGFKHDSALALAPDMADRIVVVDGVAKSYAMTGWRVGWAIAPRALIKALDTVQGQSTTHTAAVAQHAAIAALSGPQEELISMRALFEKRRNVMVDGLNTIPGIKCRKPEGAFYAFADCRGLYGLKHDGKVLANDADIAMFFLEKAHVASVPGGPFAAPGYVRFSYATGEDRIVKGLESIRSAVESAR